MMMMAEEVRPLQLTESEEGPALPRQPPTPTPQPPPEPCKPEPPHHTVAAASQHQVENQGEKETKEQEQQEQQKTLPSDSYAAPAPAAGRRATWGWPSKRAVQPSFSPWRDTAARSMWLGASPPRAVHGGLASTSSPAPVSAGTPAGTPVSASGQAVQLCAHHLRLSACL